MTGSRASNAPVWRLPAFAGLAYFVLAWMTFSLTYQTGGMASVWLPSGVLVGSLLIAENGQRRFIGLSVAIASWLANFTAGEGALTALWFTLANLAEGYLVVFIFDRYREKPSFAEPRNVGRFALSALVGATFSATLAILWIGRWDADMFLSWQTTVTLGLLIGAPLIVSMHHRLRSFGGRPPSNMVLEGVALFALSLAVSVGVFFQTAYPLLFLPMLATYLATYRLGPCGAAGSIAIHAMVGSYAVTHGVGPVAFVDSSFLVQMLFFQFYLLTLLVSALPLAALLAQRAQMFKKVEQGNRLLQLAEEVGGVGHWRVDLQDNSLFWSAEVFRIHGLHSTELPSLEDAIDAYAPEDRELVNYIIEDSILKKRSFQFSARIVRPDDTIRHVESRGQVETNAKGEAIAVFGVFQDVTERTLAMQELAEAHRQARRDAHEAKVLSETDQLTGIANRRRILELLDEAMRTADRTQGELCIAMFDIDHFKSINDQLGHGVGDDVLKGIARCCLKGLRSDDHLGRLGGEEFLIVLPGTTTEAANRVVERLRSSIESLVWQADPKLTVTASFGIARYRPDIDQAKLLHAADSALYAAKREGRNRLRIAA